MNVTRGRHAAIGVVDLHILYARLRGFVVEAEAAQFARVARWSFGSRRSFSAPRSMNVLPETTHDPCFALHVFEGFNVSSC